MTLFRIKGAGTLLVRLELRMLGHLQLSAHLPGFERLIIDFVEWK